VSRRGFNCEFYNTRLLLSNPAADTEALPPAITRTLLSASALSAPAVGGLGGLKTNESRKRLRATTTGSYTGVNINPENDVGVAYTYAKIVSVEVRCSSRRRVF
jgi:hypothetical protein